MQLEDELLLDEADISIFIESQDEGNHAVKKPRQKINKKENAKDEDNNISMLEILDELSQNQTNSYTENDNINDKITSCEIGTEILSSFYEKYLSIFEMIDRYHSKLSFIIKDNSSNSQEEKLSKMLSYLLQTVSQADEIKDSNGELEKKTQEMEKNQTFFDGQSKILESLISWIVHTEQYLQTLTQDYQNKSQSLVNLSDCVNGIAEIKDNCLKSFENRSIDELSIIDCLKNNITHCCRILSTKIAELSYKDRYRNHERSGINFSPNLEKSREISALKLENEQLKAELENAKEIIINNHLPPEIFEVLNEVREGSIKETLNMDEKYRLQKKKLENEFIGVFTEMEKEMSCKNAELERRDKEIKDLKMKLEFSMKKYDELKKINKDLALQSDQLYESSMIEIRKMKSEMSKMRKECCDHCLFKCPVNTADKCLGDCVETCNKSILTSFEKHNRSSLTNMSKNNIEQKKDDRELRMKIVVLEKTIQEQREIIISQQNTINSLNKTSLLFQNLFHENRAQQQNAHTEFYTATSKVLREKDVSVLDTSKEFSFASKCGDPGEPKPRKKRENRVAFKMIPQNNLDEDVGINTQGRNQNILSKQGHESTFNFLQAREGRQVSELRDSISFARSENIFTSTPYVKKVNFPRNLKESIIEMDRDDSLTSVSSDISVDFV